MSLKSLDPGIRRDDGKVILRCSYVARMKHSGIHERNYADSPDYGPSVLLPGYDIYHVQI